MEDYGTLRGLESTVDVRDLCCTFSRSIPDTGMEFPQNRSAAGSRRVSYVI